MSPGDPVPDVTVVLPTHRRPAALRRVLAGLAVQDAPGAPWDLVVVDNDDGPGSAPVIATELAAFPVPARAVREEQLGASHARNRGIAEASGTIIAFIDDDVVPDADWLARVIEPIREGRCDGVGGRVQLDPTVTRPPWMAPWILPYLAEFHPSDLEVDLRSLAPGMLREPYLLTANAAFTADVLRRSGGFDTRLGPRQGTPTVNDDLSLCRRVLGVGGTIRYVPSARVVHELPVGRTRRWYVARRLYAQGRSDWLIDREMWTKTRAAGVRSGLVLLGRELADAARGRALKPSHTFLWCQAARRAGFLREASAELGSRLSGRRREA